MLDEEDEIEEVKELDEDEKFLEEAMLKSINIMLKKLSSEDRHKIYLACMKLHNAQNTKPRGGSRW